MRGERDEEPRSPAVANCCHADSLRSGCDLGCSSKLTLNVHPPISIPPPLSPHFSISTYSQNPPNTASHINSDVLDKIYGAVAGLEPSGPGPSRADWEAVDGMLKRRKRVWSKEMIFLRGKTCNHRLDDALRFVSGCTEFFKEVRYLIFESLGRVHGPEMKGVEAIKKSIATNLVPHFNEYAHVLEGRKPADCLLEFLGCGVCMAKEIGLVPADNIVGRVPFFVEEDYIADKRSSRRLKKDPPQFDGDEGVAPMEESESESNKDDTVMETRPREGLGNIGLPATMDAAKGGTLAQLAAAEFMVTNYDQFNAALECTAVAATADDYRFLRPPSNAAAIIKRLLKTVWPKENEAFPLPSDDGCGDLVNVFLSLNKQQTKKWSKNKNKLNKNISNMKDLFILSLSEAPSVVIHFPLTSSIIEWHSRLPPQKVTADAVSSDTFYKKITQVGVALRSTFTPEAYGVIRHMHYKCGLAARQLVPILQYAFVFFFGFAAPLGAIPSTPSIRNNENLHHLRDQMDHRQKLDSFILANPGAKVYMQFDETGFKGNERHVSVVSFFDEEEDSPKFYLRSLKATPGKNARESATEDHMILSADGLSATLAAAYAGSTSDGAASGANAVLAKLQFVARGDLTQDDLKMAASKIKTLDASGRAKFFKSLNQQEWWKEFEHIEIDPETSVRKLSAVISSLPVEIQSEFVLLLSSSFAFSVWKWDEMHIVNLINKHMSETANGVQDIYDHLSPHPINVLFSVHYMYSQSIDCVKAQAEDWMEQKGIHCNNPPAAKYARWLSNHEAAKHTLALLELKNKKGEKFVEFFRHVTNAKGVLPKIRDVAARLYVQLQDARVLAGIQFEVDFAEWHTKKVMAWNRSRSRQGFNVGFRMLDYAYRLYWKDRVSWEKLDPDTWYEHSAFAKTNAYICKIGDADEEEAMKSSIAEAFVKGRKLHDKYYKHLNEAPCFLLNMFCEGRSGGSIRVAAAAVWAYRKKTNSDTASGFRHFNKPDLDKVHDIAFQKMVDDDPNAGEKLDSLWRLWCLDDALPDLAAMSKNEAVNQDDDIVRQFTRNLPGSPAGCNFPQLYKVVKLTISPWATTCMICELLFSQMKNNEKMGESAESLDQKIMYLINIFGGDREELKELTANWKKRSAKDDETPEQVRRAAELLLQRLKDRYDEGRMKEVGTHASAGVVGMRTAEKRKVTDRYLENLEHNEDSDEVWAKRREEYKLTPSKHQVSRKAAAAVKPFQRQLAVIMEKPLAGFKKMIFWNGLKVPALKATIGLHLPLISHIIRPASKKGAGLREEAERLTDPTVKDLQDREDREEAAKLAKKKLAKKKRKRKASQEEEKEETEEESLRIVTKQEQVSLVLAVMRGTKNGGGECKICKRKHAGGIVCMLGVNCEDPAGFSDLEALGPVFRVVKEEGDGNRTSHVVDAGVARLL